MSSKFLVFRKPEKHQTVMKARSQVSSGQNYPPCFPHVISNENVFAIIFVVFQK